MWVLNPFVIDFANLPEELCTVAQEQLLTLSSSVVFASKFKMLALEEFWLTLGPEFQNLTEIATNVLLKFSTSYMCEKGFSTMLLLKNKYRNRLEVEDDLRINLYNDDINITEIMKM
jgi:zinc finger BED domain-containing protein 5/7/8/9